MSQSKRYLPQTKYLFSLFLCTKSWLLLNLLFLPFPSFQYTPCKKINHLFTWNCLTQYMHDTIFTIDYNISAYLMILCHNDKFLFYIIYSINSVFKHRCTKDKISRYIIVFTGHYMHFRINQTAKLQRECINVSINIPAKTTEQNVSFSHFCSQCF